MKLVAFKAEHIEKLKIQDAQKSTQHWVTPAVAKALENEYAFTGVEKGRVIACGGVVPMWEGRALAWTYLSTDARKHMVPITAAVKRFLEVCPFTRVEAAVDCKFKAGHRWIKMLGFKLEAERMVAYLPSGEDCALYARVR